MIRSSFSLLLATLVSYAFIAAQTETRPAASAPKHELRAVWLTTLLGLDWPKSRDPAEQRRSLTEIVEKLAAARFNTIIFQVRSRGDAMYRSRFEPWSQQLTGTLGKDPGWDPLEVIITEAHRRGIEVHAWFNTFYVRSGNGMPPESSPRHLVLARPEWVRMIGTDWWLDPGIPAVREYLHAVAMEIVRDYDIDGMHFDFIRYPGPQYPDDESYRRYGGRTAREEWRRNNINSFVRTFYDSAVALKPMLKVGSAPIGIYTNVGKIRGLQGFAELFQDARRWIREGKHDYAAPQVYWALGDGPGNPDFAAVSRDWLANRSDRHIYIGLGVYKPEVFNQLPQLIDVSRSAGAEGNAFFRYENIAPRLDVHGRYETHALIPAMPWKDAIPPNAPRNLATTTATDGVYRIQWNAAVPAPDGDLPRSYVVYRSSSRPVDISNPGNLIAILPAGLMEYFDTLLHPTSAHYYYAVTALDKGNNESKPTEVEVLVPEIADLLDRLAPEFRLGVSHLHSGSKIAFIPYEVGRLSDVRLTIDDDRDQSVLSIVEATQKPGRYVVTADLSKLRKGVYRCRLSAGGLTLERPLKVEK